MARRRKSANRPYVNYALRVTNDELIVCDPVKRAVDRHLNDLETGEERGLRFDYETADYVIDFFGQFLRHSKGEWAGQRFDLAPWQQFVVASLFGWKHIETGYRRFRVGYLEVARKNGKTTLASGIGLYMLDPDQEPGAEVYAAATKYDQAKLTHGEATRMVKRSGGLSRRISVWANNLSIDETASKFEPLGRDHDSLDGLNIHCALVDEIHAHKTRDMWDVLETATGSRRQPLIFGITTAGYDRKSICYELHEYTMKILNGIIEDDSFFGMIYTIDKKDDWHDESCWIKANPNLDMSVYRADLQRKAKKAKIMPAAQNAFLRLHMNKWTQSETKWINPDRWRSCDGEIDELKLAGRVCYGGLDLSSNIDITAFALVFPSETEDDFFDVIVRFWVPEENAKERSRKDRVSYESWIRQGLIITTPGDVIDTNFIIKSVTDDAAAYDLREVAYDRWGAQHIVTNLQDEDIVMVQFGQGFASMSPALKEVEKLILRQGLNHGGNPVLTWMADNLVVRMDSAGNLKPDKEKSIEKIDGMVAMIMAIDRAVRCGSQASVYDDPDFDAESIIL